MSEGCRSIKSELEAIRPFVDRVISGNNPLYSEKEIREAEKRLGSPLPVPVRELYMQMADLLIGALLLTPLELLHWEGDCLGFYESPDDSAALGIRKGCDPNQLYWWELHDPEEESYDYWDEFSDLCEEGDRKGRRELARQCHAYWKDINARYPDLPPCVRKLEYEVRYARSVDAYGLFLALDAANEAFEDFQREHPGQPLFLRTDILTSDAFSRLHDQITPEFLPLSPQLLALEAHGLQMAYLHRDRSALLLAWDSDIALTLLTTDAPEPGFLDKIKAATGLEFGPCKL